MTPDAVNGTLMSTFLLTCLLRGMTQLDAYNSGHVEFLLTCLLRGMTYDRMGNIPMQRISTHMPLARHDYLPPLVSSDCRISTHMPLARHDQAYILSVTAAIISTHMPLARHDQLVVIETMMVLISTHMPLARHDNRGKKPSGILPNFYSHASCEA